MPDPCQRLSELRPIQRVHSNRSHPVEPSSWLNSPWSTGQVNPTLPVNPFNELGLSDPVQSVSQTSVSDSQCWDQFNESNPFARIEPNHPVDWTLLGQPVESTEPSSSISSTSSVYQIRSSPSVRPASATLTVGTNSTSPSQSPASARTIQWYELSLVDQSIQPNSPGQPVQRVQFDRFSRARSSDQCQRLLLLGPIQRVHSNRPHQLEQSSGMNSPWSTSPFNRTLQVNPFNEFSLTDSVERARQTSVRDSYWGDQFNKSIPIAHIRSNNPVVWTLLGQLVKSTELSRSTRSTSSVWQIRTIPLAWPVSATLNYGTNSTSPIRSPDRIRSNSPVVWTLLDQLSILGWSKPWVQSTDPLQHRQLK